MIGPKFEFSVFTNKQETGMCKSKTKIKPSQAKQSNKHTYMPLKPSCCVSSKYSEQKCDCSWTVWNSFDEINYCYVFNSSQIAKMKK